jgi:Zn-dependent peptidase ImmA (M78 family)
MSNSAYYESLKALAREKRALHGVSTALFGLREVRRIYKAEGVRIDYWPLPWKIKALYMCEDGDCSVAIQKALPDEPKLFALIHELKHHYCDREQLGNGIISSGDHNRSDAVEVGAEVFAAEFIYPLEEFAADVARQGTKIWTANDVVIFRRTVCKAKVSYTFIVKSLKWLQVVPRDAFDSVQFKKLEEQMFGVPGYRRRRRAA